MTRCTCINTESRQKGITKKELNIRLTIYKDKLKEYYNT